MARFDCRTAFLSDLHLGTRECRADFLLDFLQRLQCERLVLVGDVFDLWAMRRRLIWTEQQSAVLDQIFALAATGVEVVYIPGNHDARLRAFAGVEIRGVRIRRSLEHQTVDGRRFLISHGDEFDDEVKHGSWQHWVGDVAYQWLLRSSHWLNRTRNAFGLHYWSLSAWAKTRLGRARDYIGRFQKAAVRCALAQGYDGFICGHIHKAAIEDIDGILYCNTGDWVEHCTALIEDHDGLMHLIHWSDHGRLDASDSTLQNQ